MSPSRLIVRGLLLPLVPALLAAQLPSGVVTGRISARADSAAPAPVSDATVSIVGSTLGGTTSVDGRFLIERVPVGAATLRIRLLGYRTVDRAIRVRAGDTLRVDVVLQTEAQLLSGVRTDARRADAELFLTKPSIATITMNAAAMAGVPSVGEPDVIRLVQLLPGVAARNDFNTGLNVRGGSADQNLVLLDGYQIYNPFHLGGLSSTFMDATVGGIELITGAFPSRFGGRLSSVLDVRSAEDVRSDLHASADISAVATTGRVAGSFGGKGTWSVAARRTYADRLASIFTDNIFPYHFTDYHGRATYQLPADVRLSVTAYGGRDVLDANLAEFETDTAPTKAIAGQWKFNWGNRVVGATVAKDLAPATRVPLIGFMLGDSTTVAMSVSSSGFSTLLDLGDGALSQRSEIRDIRTAFSLVTRGESHDRSFGYDIASHRLRYAAGSSQTGTSDFDLVQQPESHALWVDDLWRLSSKWLVDGGIRAEALSGRNWAAISPRVALKYFATPNFALTAGAGRITQWQHSLAGDGPLRYFDIWIASDSFIPVSTAWHYIAGVERRFGDVGSVKIEGYLKQYDNVQEANRTENPQVRGDEFISAQGQSYGVDFLARWQRSSGATGWFSYSYGMSTRTRNGITWAPGNDRRHDLNIVGTRPFAKYRVGARFGFATGTPFTPIVGGIARRIYDPSTDRWGTGNPQIFIESLGGARNSERYPANHRLDFDISREYMVRGTKVSPYLSVANAYNAKNVFVYLYNYNTDAPTRRAISQFPILPSAGVRLEF